MKNWGSGHLSRNPPTSEEKTARGSESPSGFMPFYRSTIPLASKAEREILSM